MVADSVVILIVKSHLFGLGMRTGVVGMEANAQCRKEAPLAEGIGRASNACEWW